MWNASDYVNVKEVIKIIERLHNKAEINSRQKEIIIQEIFHECIDQNRFKRPK